MRGILDHASDLFNNNTEPLFTPGFWILPLCRELLNSACRNRPSAASEIFFEFMPWARGSDSYQTFCLWLAIPSCWRKGESKSCVKTTQTQNTTNQNPTKKPKQPKKTPRKLRETLRFQKVPKLSTALRCHSKSHIDVPSDSKYWSAGRWWSCIIPVIEQGWEVGSMKLRKVVLPWTDVCCMPIVVIYVFVVTDTRVKEPGSATDANVNMHGCNKDVVGGMSE